jgi:hypothetical protein
VEGTRDGGSGVGEILIPEPGAHGQRTVSARPLGLGESTVRGSAGDRKV